MLLTNYVNELTVWADKLEDEGLDVSLLRNLCFYNYVSCLMAYGDIYYYCRGVNVDLLIPSFGDGSSDGSVGNGNGYFASTGDSYDYISDYYSHPDFHNFIGYGME